tara:strand:- start:3911 stop:4900 length:990 start_codon:yes stop_codon:yes gene_type:complete
MPRIRLTSFNCENLMMRFAFGETNIPQLKQKLTLVSDSQAADLVDEAFDVLSEDDRTLTAQTLAVSKADVCLLQEVENLVTLTAFHNRYLRRWSRSGYEHRILREGNDGRGIDVAALSRLHPVRITSHAHLTFEGIGLTPPAGQSRHDPVFRRDCLRLDYEIEAAPLSIFVCHFKSMHGGRYETRTIRQTEALAVRRLIERSFDDPATANWLVCGDLNDFLEQDGRADSGHGLGPFVDDGFARDALMMSGLGDMDRWTHHYSGDNTYSALDHFLLSPALAEKNVRPDMTITRCGLPWKAERYEGFRLPGIAWSNPKASDHCPLSLELSL